MLGYMHTLKLFSGECYNTSDDGYSTCEENVSGNSIFIELQFMRKVNDFLTWTDKTPTCLFVDECAHCCSVD